MDVDEIDFLFWILLRIKTGNYVKCALLFHFLRRYHNNESITHTSLLSIKTSHSTSHICIRIILSTTNYSLTHEIKLFSNHLRCQKAQHPELSEIVCSSPARLNQGHWTDASSHWIHSDSVELSESKPGLMW